MEQLPLQTLGKGLIIVGGIIIVLGVVFLFGDKIPLLGKLPGDIHWKGKGGSFYFPIVTCIVISLLLTLLANLFFRK